jgi:hypothetical protein
MRRTLLIPAVSVSLLTLIPGMASAAPPGEGLTEPFPVECAGLGVVMVVEPRSGGRAPTSWTLDGDHIVLQSAQVSANGTPVFSKTWGMKAGLTTMTCEAFFEEDGVVFHAQAQAALVPPG